MQVKQTVTAKFNTVYTGWNSLDFTDEQGDEIQIRMTDECYLSLFDTIKNKVDRIHKERTELAAEQQRALEAKGSEDE